MYPINIRELCELTQGTLVGQVNAAAMISGAVIDSRDVQQGDAFFALRGANRHGIQFATDALRDGANVVVVDQAVSAQIKAPHLAVPDAEIALAELAHQNRCRSDALVVAVTGSVGKTTTRRLITSVLDTTHTGIQSPRNFNNYLGVPLSLLELQEDDEFAVIEIAASAPGEVSALAAIAEPEMAVVTRVAPAHLAGLRSLQEVQKAKSELVQTLSRQGTAFLNIDDPLVAAMASVTSARVITFGTSAEADVRATQIQPLNDQLRLIVDGYEYLVPICGRHNATNVLAAIAVGMEVGIPVDRIAAGLQSFEATPGRSFVTQVGHWTVIDDTYNSSPASVSAAVRMAEEFEDCRHRILVLNDMLDLGEQAADLHYGVGALLADSKIDHIAVVGNFSTDVVEGFLASGGTLNRISRFSDLNLLTTMLDCLLSSGDLVVVKGSRATAMEQVLQQLRTLCPTTTPNIRRAA
ncbi:MAG: UDP-N-acetylmuramoyl-tripeptide--D-alanyl-D-alanine ligase [Planctomycetaceae bacterium]